MFLIEQYFLTDRDLPLDSKSFERVLFCVSHNIAKIEEHRIDGKRRRVVVHRKGATRAFPSGMGVKSERARL